MPIFDRPRMTANRRSDGLVVVASAAANTGSADDAALASPAEATRVNCRRLSMALQAASIVPYATTLPEGRRVSDWRFRCTLSEMATRAPSEDYYEVLGLRPEAAETEIRKAYRRLALRWHPDRNPGNGHAEESFKEISEAYAVLIDPAKRRDYDRARRAGTPYVSRHTREDLFRDLFADPGASAVFEELARELERRGLRVDRHHFRQTLFGGRAVVTGGVFIVTPLTPVLAMFRLARAALRGAAALPSSTRDAPSRARPRGILERVVRAGRWLLELPPGPASPPRAGNDVTIPLHLTRAEVERGGRKQLTLDRDGARHEVLVTIPPGLRPGARLRLRGKGRAAPGHLRGDVYLAVQITGRVSGCQSPCR
jgi:curved DNA-binding protein CbpA